MKIVNNKVFALSEYFRSLRLNFMNHNKFRVGMVCMLFLFLHRR